MKTSLLISNVPGKIEGSIVVGLQGEFMLLLSIF